MNHSAHGPIPVPFMLPDGRTLIGRVSKIRNPQDAHPALWQAGDWGELTDVISEQDVLAFARVSRDVQWIHTDIERAKAKFGGLVVHGALTASLISALYGNVMPGEGAFYLEAEIAFKKKVLAGESITARATIASFAANGVMCLDNLVTNAAGDEVAIGKGKVLVRSLK